MHSSILTSTQNHSLPSRVHYPHSKSRTSLTEGSFEIRRTNRPLPLLVDRSVLVRTANGESTANHHRIKEVDVHSTAMATDRVEIAALVIEIEEIEGILYPTTDMVPEIETRHLAINKGRTRTTTLADHRHQQMVFPRDHLQFETIHIETSIRARRRIEMTIEVLHARDFHQEIDVALHLASAIHLCLTIHTEIQTGDRVMIQTTPDTHRDAAAHASTVILFDTMMALVQDHATMDHRREVRLASMMNHHCDTMIEVHREEARVIRGTTTEATPSDLTREGG